MIDGPAVAADQHEYAPEPVPHSGASNLVHTRLQRRIQQFRFGLLVPTRTALLAHQTGALDAYSIVVDQMADELLTLRRP